MDMKKEIKNGYQKHSMAMKSRRTKMTIHKLCLL